MWGGSGASEPKPFYWPESHDRHTARTRGPATHQVRSWRTRDNGDMRPRDVEIWALAVLQRIARGGVYESALVELKADWPNPQRTARRIAGHANAARGDNILWLIGVDEK
jgi:hypothetical protein